MTRAREIVRDGGRKHRRETSAGCEAELQRVLSSRVFNGGKVKSDDGAWHRFGGSQTHKAILERLVRAYLEGRTPTAHDVTGGTKRASNYVYITLPRVIDRLADYYCYEGAENPSRVEVELRTGVIYVECYVAPVEPCEQEYEQALFHLNRQSPGNLQKAREHVEEALRLDDTHAPSHALHAEVLLLEAMHTFTSPTTTLRKRALEAAQRAVALDSSLWRAHAALGGVCEWNLDFAGSKSAFEQARRLDSLRLWDYESYYGFLVASGDMDGALKLAWDYQRDRPADPIAHRTYSVCLHVAGRQLEAEQASLKALRLDPGLWLASLTLVLVYLASGRPQKALAYIEPLVRAEPYAWPGIHIICLAGAGQRQQARRKLAGLKKRAQRQYVQPVQFALAHMGLGDLDRGIDYLAASLEERHPLMDWVHRWPIFEPLRAHPGYTALLRRFKIPVDANRPSHVRRV
jgi:tetratricopeptide (TPR) repeat protein